MWSPSVQAVIDRSHNSRANYAVFLKTEVAYAGARRTEVDVEFHQGSMHRVEVPARRLVVNCETSEGAVYDVVNRRYVDDPDELKGACGISLTVDSIASARMLAPISGPYGRADRVELTGKKFVRRYAVTSDGIIVANDYVPQGSDVVFSLHTVSTVLKRGPQPAAMFTRESLTRDFASEALAASGAH